MHDGSDPKNMSNLESLTQPYSCVAFKKTVRTSSELMQHPNMSTHIVS